MISEISGLADLFMVFTSFVLSILYTPFQLESILLKHMGHVEMRTKQKKQQSKSESMLSKVLDLQSIAKIISEVTSYHKLKLSAYWIISH